MKRSNVKKIAFIAGLSKCLIYAEAKYCAFEIGGNPKYYVCPKTEYCCNFGCCVSPGFQIYHLWYYWLLVIAMFLVCSGGGWWYRYWLQGRYRAAASVIPTTTRPTNSRSHSLPQRGSICQGQQASISYNSSRNTVLLHRMWKGPHRGNPTSPPYTTTLATNSSHYQNPTVVLNDLNCPYYQLYGPPPSYETVIAQSRVKNQSSASASACEQRETPSQPANTTTNTTQNNPQLQLNNCDYYESTGNNLNCHDSLNNTESLFVRENQCLLRSNDNLNTNSTQFNRNSNLPVNSIINPSDNVILGTLNNHRINYNLAQINYQRPSTSNEYRYNFNYKSMHKLERSKSLD